MQCKECNHWYVSNCEVEVTEGVCLVQLRKKPSHLATDNYLFTNKDQTCNQAVCCVCQGEKGNCECGNNIEWGKP